MVIQLSTRGLMTVVFRRWLVIMAAFVIAVGAALAFVLVSTPIYEMRSSMLVKFGRQADYRPDQDGGSNNTPLDRKEIINSHARIIQSPELLGRVLDEIGIANLYPDLIDPTRPDDVTRNLAIMRFNDALQVATPRETNVIEVAFRHFDAQLGTRATNLLIDRFIEKELRLFSDPQSSFMQQQVETFRVQVSDAQEALRRYKQDSSISSLDEERTLILQQRGTLDATLKDNEAKTSQLQRKRDSLVAALKQVTPDVELFRDTAQDKSLEEAKTKRVELELKEGQLLQTYKPDSQAVTAVRDELRIVKEAIARAQAQQQPAVRTGKNQVFQEIQLDMLRTTADLNSLQASGDLLRGQLNDLNDRLRTLDQRQNGLQDLTRQYQVAETNYRNYLQRMEDARINEDLNRQKITSIAVIQPAEAPIRPVFPRKMATVALGIVMGLIVGLGLAFVLELLDDGFTAPMQIERSIGLPVLASVATIDHPPVRPALLRP